MAKNSKSNVAKKAGIIGGVAIGAAATGVAATVAYDQYTGEEVPMPEEEEVLVDPEVEVEEDVEVEYDEPVEASVTYVAHPQHVEEVVDPIAENVNEVALEVEPEDAFIGHIDHTTEEAIEIAEVAEEDFNVDDIVDDILSDDTTQFSYNETTEEHEFGADFDYASDNLG